MTFEHLREICEGQWVTDGSDIEITSLVLDTRPERHYDSGAVFVALKGPNHDAHKYLSDAYQRGIRNFIVEHGDFIPGEDAVMMRVPNSLDALQEAGAAKRRSNKSIEVIGITGSNGKTIVKEWLATMLSPFSRIVRNPGSYNSQVGVPLSLWLVGADHETGIFEAGISRPGEMEALQQMIRPKFGIFTNIGQAHAAGFESMEEKVAEKMKLFSECDRLIYCRDQILIHEAVTIPSYTWGSNSASDLHIASAEPVGNGYQYHLQAGERTFSLNIPFSDPPSLENVMHVVAFMVFRGFEPSVIQEGIYLLRPMSMRLEIKQGILHSTLIDDTYNNDLSGIKNALEFMSARGSAGTGKIMIVSDILQSDEPWIDEVLSFARQSSINLIIGIGPVWNTAHFESTGINVKTFPSTGVFLEQAKDELVRNSTVLIKGARSFSFERISTRFEEKVHGTVLEVSLENLANNLNLIRSFLGEEVKLMVMVKAFAYGSGSKEVAALLRYHKVDYLGVAYTDEGVALRNEGIDIPIMVMNPAPDQVETLLKFNLEPEIYSEKLLDEILSLTGGRKLGVHIKFDTGMHRLGFEEAGSWVSRLAATPGIRVRSVFTHLASAEDPAEDAFTRQQVDRFVQLADALDKELGYSPLRHVLNSAGITRFPEFRFNMVRLGIGLHGIGELPEYKPVSRLRTYVSQIKTVSAGETIGYGRKGKALGPLRTATIAIGYADGYSRAFSNGVGKVWLNGSLAPVIGNVCMDMTMIDITGLKAEEGDSVVIFGPELSIVEIASWIDTIPYEILTGVSERVRRVYVN